MECTMVDYKEFVQYALDMGAKSAKIISTEKVNFRPEFRRACEQNSCGKYGRCWMCPPDVGDIDEMIEQAKEYKNIFVFQTVWDLEDSYDIEGMEAGAEGHNRLAQKLAKRAELDLPPTLKLAAGACQVCPSCSRVDNEPCRYPELAIASLEAYGIAVSELAEACGMKYINGTNTVTYFGAFLF